MPTYEYKCTECGSRFERWQSIKDDPLKECPECGGLPQRVIFPVGIVFKGSGFYVTDNRKSNGSDGSSSSSTSSSSSDGDKGKDSKAEPAKAASS